MPSMSILYLSISFMTWANLQVCFRSDVPFRFWLSAASSWLSPGTAVNIIMSTATVVDVDM